MKGEIYYCMTGRAIQGNTQFEGGRIGSTEPRRQTEAEGKWKKKIEPEASLVRFEPELW